METKAKYWQLRLGIVLIAISIGVYYLQITLFNDMHETFFLMFQDLAFLPIEVLLVTILVHGLLSWREKKAMLAKMNMLIGVFFSEVGIELAKRCFVFDDQAEVLKKILSVEADWDQKKYLYASKNLEHNISHITVREGDLEELKIFLCAKRNLLLALLANPSLLEHDSFTELMRAVYHLMEELEYRQELSHLPAADYAHLGVDLDRVYRLLGKEWLDYVHYLKKYYPYLYSLAIRSNPFNDSASVIIKDKPDRKA